MAGLVPKRNGLSKPNVLTVKGGVNIFVVVI